MNAREHYVEAETLLSAARTDFRENITPETPDSLALRVEARVRIALAAAATHLDLARTHAELERRETEVLPNIWLDRSMAAPGMGMPSFPGATNTC